MILYTATRINFTNTVSTRILCWLSKPKGIPWTTAVRVLGESASKDPISLFKGTKLELIAPRRGVLFQEPCVVEESRALLFLTRQYELEYPPRSRRNEMQILCFPAIDCISPSAALFMVIYEARHHHQDFDRRKGARDGNGSRTGWKTAVCGQLSRAQTYCAGHGGLMEYATSAMQLSLQYTYYLSYAFFQGQGIMPNTAVSVFL